ncbi:MAG: circadian clock KaiB family protein [Dokdonella sp.]|uniref:circadian clock KaiB family protein n=1 Tax=Dokdonella sp. TaxID=2291710 RepID=UPI003267A2D1
MTAPLVYRFRLYVADDVPNSAEAIANLAAMCDQHLPGRHEVEIVDVFKHPQRALADGIFMTPALIKLFPAPVRKIAGTLSDVQIVLHALGLGNLAA